MELLQVEERTESELSLKEQELELAKVELEAWNDEVDLFVSTVTPNVLGSCGPVSSNDCEITPATSSKSVRQNAQRSAQSSTQVTYTNVDYALNLTRVTKPTSHQPVRVSFSMRPINVITEARPLKLADEKPFKSAEHAVNNTKLVSMWSVVFCISSLSRSPFPEIATKRSPRTTSCYTKVRRRSHELLAFRETIRSSCFRKGGRLRIVSLTLSKLRAKCTAQIQPFIKPATVCQF